MYTLDNNDQVILNILQNTFPLSLQPYQDMGTQLGISEDEVLQRIARMKAAGLIRRIGGIMDSRQLGFYSSLCTMTVPEDRIEEIAILVNQNTGVTHNYLRDHHYNMWFTMTAVSQPVFLQQIQELEKLSGLKVISMPTRKVYKIKVSFDMG